MRKPRSKKRKGLGINKPDSEEFRKLLEECSIEQEVAEAYNKSGKNFYNLDPETRMEIICEKLK